MTISIEEAKLGFMYCLLGSDRPIYESFAPNLINQKDAMENQFSGMTELPFTYEDYEETRSDLITRVKNLMTDEDKRFLISFEQGTPYWEGSPYIEFADYPSVKWKLLNLGKLARTNPEKLLLDVDKLKILI